MKINRLLRIGVALSWLASAGISGAQTPVTGPESDAGLAPLLTPKAPPTPRINGPRITGVRPGSPFLFRIPCTGERPVTFTAEGLPPGISLDPKTGILTGASTAAGSHKVRLGATNPHGTTHRELRIVVGDTLALTPPMGWNSWYIHYNRVTELHMREAADQMIESGMADYGYQYVNIDDCWMKEKKEPPYRDSNGDLLANDKFPDIKGMVDYIHSRGLRAGTYISPGPWTCAGYAGSWQHEARDARWFANMGFDFLKYDWCSYGTVAGGKELAHLKKPYQLMWGELLKQDRDIVFNLCQYGMGDVWEWGAEVGNSWRTTGDLGLERATGLPGFYRIGMSNAAHWKHARPGAWNDPDYLLIGWVGDAHGMAEGKPTTLTPDEQYSYMSMWCLMASPLIFSGDMAKLDKFTLNVLCAPELIDINQDPLGKQAEIIKQDDSRLILAKPMEDGTLAVGLFNLTTKPQRLEIPLETLGLKHGAAVRDAWRQRDLPDAVDSLGAEIPAHGVAVFRLTPKAGPATSAIHQPKLPDEVRAAQLKDMKWGMFVCWSFSTFSGREWTPGVKDVGFFAAKDCDTDQWARTAKEAGMGYILFLAKHHDGFCLWDTQTTDRKVTNAPLGRDVLAELRKSCDKHGIKLALYFSEGDWTWPGAKDGAGRGSGKDAAKEKQQLTELLTNYGSVEYMWVDHAAGTGGLTHAEFISHCQALQPNCFIGFNHGDQTGVRIRLGEEGRPGPLDDHKAAGPHMRDEPSKNYQLAEFTYPIQPSRPKGAKWFYSHPDNEDACHAPEKLYSDYLGAVKHGNIFSINVGPNPNGKLRDIDVKTLRQVGEMIRSSH
jgi:alpha-galactosidase